VTTATPVPVALALPVSVGCQPTAATTVRTPIARLTRSGASALLERLRDHPARGVVVAIGVVTTLSSTATIASPYLIGRAPLLLMCMSPRLAFLGVAARDTPLITFLLVGTARLALTDPLHYLLGQRLETPVCEGQAAARPKRGPRALVVRFVAGLPRPLRMAARPACYLAVLVRPNGVNLLWAGAQGLPRHRVAALDLVGTATYLLVLHAGAAALAS
jgi:hypothetical protein